MYFQHHHILLLKPAATDKTNSWNRSTESTDTSGNPRSFPGDNLTYSGEVGYHISPLEKTNTALVEEREFVNPLYSETTPEHSFRSETAAENLYMCPVNLPTDTCPSDPTELFDDISYATPNKPKFCEYDYASMQ